MTLTDTQRHPQHDVEITLSGTTVGFNLVTGRGEYDPLSIRAEPQPRVSIKMHQGGTKHSDYEPPYASVEDRDWSVGRGLDNSDLEEGRFYDSYRANTWMGGKIILGPLDFYGTGYRDMDMNAYNTTAESTWHQLISSGRYLASQFTASASYTIKKIYVPLRKVGSPGSFTIALYSDDGADDPDTLLASDTVTVSDTYLEYGVAEISQAVTSGTKYHVVLIANSGDDSSNYYETPCEDGSGNKSSDGSSWSGSSLDMFYRCVDEDDDYIAHFFIYNEVVYAVLSYDDGAAPKIFRNGDFGIATSGGNTTLTDSGASWTTNEWAGAMVVLFSGTGAATKDRYRTISSNTSTALTVDSAWDINPAENTRYSIINTDAWTEVTGHNIPAGPVTDVLSYNQLVYIMRGDFENMYVMRYPELANGGFNDEPGNRGTFIERAPNSDGRPKIWKARKEWVPNIADADPEWGRENVAPTALDFSVDVQVTNGDMEADSDWTDVGTPTTNEQSNTQAYEGTYSRHIVADADGEGITQTLTTNDEDWVVLSARVYLESGGVKMNFGGAEQDSTTTTGSWIHLRGFTQASGTSETLQFLSDGGAAEFYVDDVDADSLATYIENVGYERITGLVRYGEPERLWVATTGGLYMEDNGRFLPIPLEEFRQAADERNGLSLCVHDVYLYLSYLDGVERYYKSNLDDIGPNRDEGLPSGRRGNISDMVGYPGRLYAAIDGGDDNTSSVLLYNGIGWHEVWRAPESGKRIRKLFIQPIPGQEVDRLWINCGSDILWVPVDLNPQTNSNYSFAYESVIESPWIHYNKNDVDKFWKSLKIAADYEDNTAVYADYKKDSDTTWTAITSSSSYYNSEPHESIDIGSNDVSGNRIKYRLRLRTDYVASTPEVNAVIIDLIENVPVKYGYTMQFRLEDINVTLQGDEQDDRLETNYDQIASWVNNVLPATMRTRISAYDNKTVKLLSLSTRPIQVDSEGQDEIMLGTLTVIET